MLVTFFDRQEIIHKEFVPPSQMVNKEYYVEVLSYLVQRICQERPQFRGQGSWFLHDNARLHIAVAVKEFSSKKGGGDSRIKSIPIFS
jgi:hypothetical protein